jgi:hypothetical protein
MTVPNLLHRIDGEYSNGIDCFFVDRIPLKIWHESDDPSENYSGATMKSLPRVVVPADVFGDIGDHDRFSAAQSVSAGRGTVVVAAMSKQRQV